ncbi:MAG TPA: hypothetical protein VFD05_04925 [Bacilli bacterium]|nr:hypothetical protein [Bacilli bacterium]
MLAYKKSFRGIIFYLLGFVVISVAYSFYLALLLKATEPLATEAYLLTAGVAVVLLVQLVVIVTYFLRPETLVEVEDKEITIYHSRKKKTSHSLFEVTGFGRFRQSLVVTLKNNKMFVVRFLRDVEKTQLELGEHLNNFINAHSDQYFQDDENSSQGDT